MRNTHIKKQVENGSDAMRNESAEPSTILGLISGRYIYSMSNRDTCRVRVLCPAVLCSADHKQDWPPCEVVFGVENQYKYKDTEREKIITTAKREAVDRLLSLQSNEVGQRLKGSNVDVELLALNRCPRFDGYDGLINHRWA